MLPTITRSDLRSHRLAVATRLPPLVIVVVLGEHGHHFIVEAFVEIL
jgi:hypothetical protein